VTHFVDYVTFYYVVNMLGKALVTLYVGVLMHCAKAAEPIEMPFAGLTLVGRNNHVLDGVEISLQQGVIWGLFGPLKCMRCGLLSKFFDHLFSYMAVKNCVVQCSS